MHIEITIYGPQTSSIAWLSRYIHDVAVSAGRSTTIHHIDQVDDIIDSGIGSVPAVKVDGGTPFLQGDFPDFMSFTHAVLHSMLSGRGYGLLTKIVVPVLSDYDFRNGLLYAYRLACDIGAVVQIHLPPDHTEEQHVEHVMASILKGHSDLALGTALMYISDTVDADVVVWSYGTPVQPPWLTLPALYVPSGQTYEPVEVLCYHDGGEVPSIVSRLWPDVELCDGTHSADCIVTDMIVGTGHDLLIKL